MTEVLCSISHIALVQANMIITKIKMIKMISAEHLCNNSRNKVFTATALHDNILNTATTC